MNNTIAEWAEKSDKIQHLKGQLQRDKHLVNLLNQAVNVDGSYAPLSLN